MRRVNLGLSPEELGDRCGLAGYTIRRLEDLEVTNPDMRTRRLLANEFGIDVADVWPIDRKKVAA